MSTYLKSHHQLIRCALENFNDQFLKENRIFFGGGTRIALELNEYRESIDIDFLCPNKESFRAVRLQVTENSLGKLVKKDFHYPRDIRADRDAIRCFIEVEGVIIKLEFVSFADYNLEEDLDNPFFVPCISKSSCYLTKLLANADRNTTPPYKDIFDILAMYDFWGEIPQSAWDEADSHYGMEVVLKSLFQSCQYIKERQTDYIKLAIETLDIKPAYAEKLIVNINQDLIDHLKGKHQSTFNCSDHSVKRKQL